MTTTAIDAIKKINSAKAAIKAIDKEMDTCRNTREYDILKEKSYNAHLDLKMATEDLLSSVSVTLDLF